MRADSGRQSAPSPTISSIFSARACTSARGKRRIRSGKIDILRCRHVREQRIVLEHHADVALIGLVPSEIVPIELAWHKPYERNIGMVFQNYALFPHMTAAKNVIFRCECAASPARTCRSAQRRCLISSGWRASPTAIRANCPAASGSAWRWRARSRVQSDVLLLDEPLGALDKNLREQMQVEIKRIHREVGITMIYVTHDRPKR